MAYDSITTAEIVAGKPVSNPLLTKVKDNFDYLKSIVDALNVDAILNGSLEADGDSDGVPDNFTRGLFSGGSGAFDTTDFLIGTKSYKLTDPSTAGTGGGYLETDYIAISKLLENWIMFCYLASAGYNGTVQAIMRYFDGDQVQIGSNRTVYSVTSHTQAWRPVLLKNLLLPSSAVEYAKLRLVGGAEHVGGITGGTVNFDDIRFSARNATGARLLTETIEQVQVQNAFGGWNNQGDTKNITVPKTAGFLNIEADHWASNPAAVHTRFGISGNYSPEASTSEVSPTQATFTLNVQNLVGAQTLQFRQYWEGGGGYHYLRILSSHRKYYTPPAIVTVDDLAGTVT